ncbi:MAG: PIN domain-containing protein [Lachnospiraceae bacterium]|nr:PIN domain-containing protein [Lachnospiraceae bacterium]
MAVYLIDYENVHYAGWEGIEHLTKEDEVILFYSENASTIPMDLHIKVATSGARLRYIHVEKTGKNYLDFQLSALSGYLVAESGQEEFVVVSKDTGFNAIVDFWNQQDFLDKKIHFARREQIALTSSKKAVAKKAGSKKTVKQTTKKAEPKQTVQQTTKKAEPKQTVKQTTKKAETKVTARKTDTKQAAKTKAEKTKVEKEEPKTNASKDNNTKQKLAEKIKAEVKKPAVKKTLSAQEKSEIREAVSGLKLAPSDYTKIYRIFRESEDKQVYNTALVKGFKNQDKGNEIYKATRKLMK